MVTKRAFLFLAVLQLVILCCKSESSADSFEAEAGNWVRATETAKEYIEAGRSENFKQARSFCNSKGGRIAFIETKEENDYVQEVAISANRCVWMNAKNPLKDVEPRNATNYMSLSGAPINYSNWKEGLPIPGYDGIRVCTDGLWYQDNFSDSYYVLCERIFVDPWQEIKDILAEMSAQIKENENKLELIVEKLIRKN